MVDLTVPARARLRGTVRLPTSEGYYGSRYDGQSWGGWNFCYGCWDGDSRVQVGGDVLAYREYIPGYSYAPGEAPRRIDTSLLRVIDRSNADEL